jgi:hypothetical protein
LVSKANATWLGDLVDVLAVSVDGIPSSHNHIRGSQHAFDWTERGLGYLQQAGVGFVTIFTLTEHNLDELPWVTELTARYGGVAVQVHPLEPAGRALTQMTEEVPGNRELAQAWFAALGLGVAGQTSAEECSRSADGFSSRNGFARNVMLHPDIADTRLVMRRPDLVLPSGGQGIAKISSVARPLVLEPDGMVVPVSYGFPRRFAIGDVTRAPLAELADRWMVNGADPFISLVKRALDSLSSRSEDWPFVNWYSHLIDTAALLRA